MAGVLSRAAGHLRSARRPPTMTLTTLFRPSAFATGPRVSTIPRLIHTQIPPTREEVLQMIKEGVEAQIKPARGLCVDRYVRLSTKVNKLEEVTATRHTESMLTHIKSEQRVATISFRIGVTMIGLAAASQYQAEIGKVLLKVFGVPPAPPSKEEIVAAVKEDLQSAQTVTTTDISNMVQVAVAHHFLEEQKRKELRDE